MFKKLHAKLDEILAILRLLPALLGDLKATMATGQHDFTDIKSTLAEVRALTGHTATVTALAAQASVPTAVPVVLPPAPEVAAPTLHSQLAADVAGVDPMAGVKMP